MTSLGTCFKVESGIQLLARLSRKKYSLDNFYPMLFQCGPRQGQVIELFSNDKITCLLEDITCAALLPTSLDGVEAGVLILNCSGHFDYNSLISCMKDKIMIHLNALSSSNIDKSKVHYDDKGIDELLVRSLHNVYIMEIYDVTQFYTTIYNLENILMQYPNISMILIDTITAFYWTEQSNKILKMDLYLKKVLQKIQSVTKEHKVVIIYSRPAYFSSSKDSLENLEACCENPTLERINVRIHIAYSKEGIYQANVRTFTMKYAKQFKIIEDRIKWI